MKIYRFMPNGADFRSLSSPSFDDGVISPYGVLLGGSELNPDDFWFPESHAGAFDRGPVKAYKTSLFTAGLPLSDFPAFALNVPIISERAVSVLRRIGRLPRVLVPVTVDGVRYFAVKHTNKSVCDPAQSGWIGFSAPCTDTPAFCYRRAFDVSKISGEFFGLGRWYAVSDCYVTNIFVDEAREAGLTGLEYLELVHDEEGPVIPIYPGNAASEQIERVDERRLFMERANLSERWMWPSHAIPDEGLEECLEGLFRRGLVSFEFVQPSYVRSLDVNEKPR